ncbi:hypothetical protein JTB14_009209 [Gonioctena quinquepunctata]|nr:hypothetical protein JTB14_009209 [Gonioctena quinquepunctata]
MMSYLFIAYTADLPFVLNSPHAMYADDSKIFNNARTDHAASQVDLEAKEKWSQDWSIPLNEGECAVLHLGKNNLKHTYLTSKGPVASVNKQVDLSFEINSKLAGPSTSCESPKRPTNNFI